MDDITHASEKSESNSKNSTSLNHHPSRHHHRHSSKRGPGKRRSTAIQDTRMEDVPPSSPSRHTHSKTEQRSHPVSESSDKTLRSPEARKERSSRQERDKEAKKKSKALHVKSIDATGSVANATATEEGSMVGAISVGSGQERSEQRRSDRAAKAAGRKGSSAEASNYVKPGATRVSPTTDTMERRRRDKETNPTKRKTSHGIDTKPGATSIVYSANMTLSREERKTLKGKRRHGASRSSPSSAANRSMSTKEKEQHKNCSGNQGTNHLALNTDADVYAVAIGDNNAPSDSNEVEAEIGAEGSNLSSHLPVGETEEDQAEFFRREEEAITEQKRKRGTYIIYVCRIFALTVLAIVLAVTLTSLKKSEEEAPNPEGGETTTPTLQTCPVPSPSSIEYSLYIEDEEDLGLDPDFKSLFVSFNSTILHIEVGLWRPTSRWNSSLFIQDEEDGQTILMADTGIDVLLYDAIISRRLQDKGKLKYSGPYTCLTDYSAVIDLPVDSFSTGIDETNQVWLESNSFDGKRVPEKDFGYFTRNPH